MWGNHFINVFQSFILTFIFEHAIKLLFKVQGFFICHIIVIQGIIRSEMKSNQVRSVDSAKNKNTNYIK